jgi:hypothetical protein
MDKNNTLNNNKPKELITSEISSTLSLKLGRPMSYSESYVSEIKYIPEVKVLSKEKLPRIESSNLQNLSEPLMLNEEDLIESKDIKNKMFSINSDTNLESYTYFKRSASAESLNVQENKTEIKQEIKEYKSFHYKDRCEMIFNKIMLFFIHLFLISAFELLFFFMFVTKSEDNAINLLFTSITNSATSACSTFNQTDKQIINYVINDIINGTVLLNNANQQYLERQSYNKQLLTTGLLYFFGLFIINVLIVLINKFKFKRKINYKGIILDNLVMISLLGLYEYMFFSNIVFEYETITPNELIYNIYNNFIISC